MQVPANEELAHVSSRAYAHLTNKRTNENTPNGVIEKTKMRGGNDDSEKAKTKRSLLKTSKKKNKETRNFLIETFVCFEFYS